MIKKFILLGVCACMLAGCGNKTENKVDVGVLEESSTEVVTEKITETTEVFVGQREGFETIAPINNMEFARKKEHIVRDANVKLNENFFETQEKIFRSVCSREHPYGNVNRDISFGDYKEHPRMCISGRNVYMMSDGISYLYMAESRGEFTSSLYYVNDNTGFQDALRYMGGRFEFATVSTFDKRENADGSVECIGKINVGIFGGYIVMHEDKNGQSYFFAGFGEYSAASDSAEEDLEYLRDSVKFTDNTVNIFDEIGDDRVLCSKDVYATEVSMELPDCMSCVENPVEKLYYNYFIDFECRLCIDDGAAVYDPYGNECEMIKGTDGTEWGKCETYDEYRGLYTTRYRCLLDVYEDQLNQKCSIDCVVEFIYHDKNGVSEYIDTLMSTVRIGKGESAPYSYSFKKKPDTKPTQTDAKPEEPKPESKAAEKKSE